MKGNYKITITVIRGQLEGSTEIADLRDEIRCKSCLGTRWK